MTKSLQRIDAAAFLLHHDQYVILTHVRPDGDTLGSASALCLGLRSLGKTAYILENTGVSPRFSWMVEGLTTQTVGEKDTVISTDVASPGMLPDNAQPLLGRVSLRIDHHGSATSFSDLELVDPDSASCAEVVFDVLELMDCRRSPEIMDRLYVGLSTDTGCFRFANTTAHTFKTAAVCAQAGARIYELNQELFETNTLGKLRMQGWIVEHMRLLRQGSMAICAIPRTVEQELGVTSDDMDNISNFPRTVAGVNIAATLRETEDGLVKISVRAVPGYDATLIAESFGGGGHKGAAGASLHVPMAQAEALVEKAMMECCQ